MGSTKGVQPPKRNRTVTVPAKRLSELRKSNKPNTGLTTGRTSNANSKERHGQDIWDDIEIAWASRKQRTQKDSGRQRKR